MKTFFILLMRQRSVKKNENNFQIINKTSRKMFFRDVKHYA